MTIPKNYIRVDKIKDATHWLHEEGSEDFTKGKLYKIHTSNIYGSHYVLNDKNQEVDVYNLDCYCFGVFVKEISSQENIKSQDKEIEEIVKLELLYILEDALQLLEKTGYDNMYCLPNGSIWTFDEVRKYLKNMLNINSYGAMRCYQ